MKQRTNRYKITLFSLAVLFFVFMPHTIEASEETGAQKTTFPVQVIQKTGDDNENFVILIMGDGYTADQQDQFLADAARKAQGMLTWSPYKEYSDHINIYAMQVVSNEQGIGVYGEKGPDTYFHVTVIGKAPQFFNGGTDKARALRSEMEEKYLDAGANVGTIHILSNADGSYGASQNSLFSFSANVDTNEVLATDKTAEQAWSTVRIHYQMRNEDGTESDVPHTMTSTVYVPDGSMYTLRKPALSGYTCVGSSVSEDQVRVTGEGIDLTYYYQENVAPPENTDQKIAECSTRPVRVTYDAKPHTFDITPGDGVTMHYSMTEDGAYSLQKLPFYTDAGNYTVYYEASAASAKPSYGQAELEIIKADTGLQLTAATQKTEGGKTVTLQLKRQGLPASEPVGISCNDAAIRIDKTQNDKWNVTFPNMTKTYTFMAQYNGNNNYTGSKASCQIVVTKKVAETPAVTPVVKPEENPVVKPEEKPVKKPVKKISEIVINAKPKVKKDTARIENADASIKKQVNKIGKQAKNVSVKIRYNTKKKKNLILKLDRSTIKLLVKKEVKELQLDNGNVRAVLDLKTLKELNKRVNADIYLQIKKADKRKLSAKTKKMIGKRPVYEVSITTTRAKTKQLSKVKKGKITIETRCTCSKTKRKKHMSSYAIDKKGNIIKKQKTSYDTKKKVIRYTTSQHSQRVTGE